MSVLVDSSVWIAASHIANKECHQLKRMIEKDERIHLIRPIQAEVCQGARTEQQFHQLWESFLGFEFLEVDDRTWGTSAWNYFKCRKQGLSVTTLDCLIATVAREYDVRLWSLDRNFKRMQAILGFEMFSG